MRILKLYLIPGVIALGIFTAVNWYISQKGELYWQRKDPDSFAWRTKVEWIRRGPIDKYSTLILGDSQAMSGVLPRALGPDVYNLGLPSLQPEGLESLIHLLEKRNYFQATSIPANTKRRQKKRNLIINVNAFAMFKSEVYRAFLTYYRNELLEYDPVALLRRPDLAGDTPGVILHRLFYSLIPAYRHHGEIRGALSFEANLGNIAPANLRDGRIPSPPVLERIRTYLENWRYGEKAARRIRENRRLAELLRTNQGYWTWKLFTPPGPLDCKRDSIPPVALRGGLAYKERPRAVKSWRRLLVKLDALGVNVYLMQAPLSGVWEKAARPDIYKRLDAKLAELTRDLPGVRLLRRPLNWPTDDPSLFHDWTHLSYCGAEIFSRYLKEQTQRESSEPATK